MSLAPYYVLWAIILGTLVLLNGAIAWLFIHKGMIRVLRRLWLADLVAAWLAYAAAYHLVFLHSFRDALGEPYALWMLCAFLAGYALARAAPTPLRTPERLFVAAVLAWALLIAGGYRFIEETEAAAELLRDRPKAALSGAQPDLRPLRRGLLLSRLGEETREATRRVLRELSGGEATAPDALQTFRLMRIPEVVEAYERDLAKLRTYQWVQITLLAATLLAWGVGRVPDWESL